MSAKGRSAADTLAMAMTGRERVSPPATRASAGEPEPGRFDALFLRHYGRVRGILRRLLGSDEEAEDAAQEVFLRLYRQESPPADEVGLSRWLARVATNVGLNALRSDRRQAARLQREATLTRAEAPGREAGEDPVAAALAREQAELVRAALEGLAPRARAALALRSGGMAYAEIAEALGVAPGSVGTILARAEREFRQRYLALSGDSGDSGDGGERRFSDANGRAGRQTRQARQAERE